LADELTMHQIGPLFGISHAAAHRMIDTIGPLLALAPVRNRRADSVAIVDGTLVPTRDLAAPSKSYRYSINVQGRDRRRHPSPNANAMGVRGVTSAALG
jgi:hypothetical protein